MLKLVEMNLKAIRSELDAWSIPMGRNFTKCKRITHVWKDFSLSVGRVLRVEKQHSGGNRNLNAWEY